MPAIDVVVDANVALKWFHEAGEDDVAGARALLDRHRDRTIVAHVLDLTLYEVGNALLRGHAHAGPEQVAVVLDALAEICPMLAPEQDELALAAALADAHGLTLYDAAYAAVARRRTMRLATLDRELLEAGLGMRPAELVDELDGRARRADR
jgi:predicted nucleic acid-binding protein